jgi:tetraacyldisaccharide 4'-kinase
VSATSWVNRIWYGSRYPPLWAVPASLLFRAIVAARRALYQRGWFKTVRLGCPVIVVGNLSVGGTGKTPLVCWLAQSLRSRGFRPGIVTRGYGGSERPPQLIDADADALVFGDEPVMMARRTALPVAVGRDRPAAARLLLEAGCDVVVSDDGMQHYALGRDCEIIVIDGDRRFGNGWVLPAGPLREPKSRLKSADAVVVNGGRGLLAGALVMKLDGNEAVAVAGGAVRPLREFVGTAVHAIAGIGNPERFFNMLRAHGIQVTGHALNDHARFERGMIDFADEKPVLMTEKDAVKCAALADRRHYYVPVGAQFEPDDEKALLSAVERVLPARPA